MMQFLFGAVMFLLGAFFGMLIISFAVSVQKQMNNTDTHLRIVRND